MEAGELLELSTWLRENLYSLGRKFKPLETLERVTGSSRIDPEPYLAYLREKATAVAA
jgi:Zn-dependent M32 family carboxypeptidase